MLRTALRPRWLALLIVVLAAASGMARLGQWQWDRAHEQGAAAQRRAVEIAPVVLAGLLQARRPFTNAVADRPVTTSGSYDAGDQLLVPGRRLGAATGLWVLTPLVQADGTAVPVVRGWVSTAADPQASAAAVPRGPVHLVGVLRPTEPPVDRPPGQTAGLPLGQIDRVDGTQLVQRWPWPLLTGYLVLTSEQPAVTGLRPVPAVSAAGGLALVNVSYAVQWFIFAGFGIVMWGRLVRDDHRGLLRPAAGPNPGSPPPGGRGEDGDVPEQTRTDHRTAPDDPGGAGNDPSTTSAARGAIT